MRLNLKNIIYAPGGSVPFDFQLDLSHLDFNGEHPIREAVHMTGYVRNMAGALVLEGMVNTTLHLTCDRCTEPFMQEQVVPVDTLLATELAEESSEGEILLLEGYEVDLGNVATTALVLAMDSKNLCSEDCEGFCSGCGENLNAKPCRCKPEVDPRLASLAKLLEKKESK